MALNNLELLDKFREVINLEIIESQSDIKRLSKDFYNYSPVLSEKLDGCIADLVVRRDGIARQLRGRLQAGGRRNQLNLEAPKAYHDLTACIECYACLDNCPMHARNFNNDLPTNTHGHQSENDEGYRWGNPFSLLKLQRLRLDPMSNELGRAKAVQHAVELGLDTCRNCPGCKCGVGIDLKGEVIKPLLKASSMSAGNQE